MADTKAPSLKLGPQDRGSESIPFELIWGSGKLHFQWDGTGPGAPLYLCVGETRLYVAGTHCTTCEFFLRLCGWDAERACDVGVELSDSVENGAQLNEAWLRQWLPVLGQLHSGTNIAYHFQMPVEEITVERKDRSWLNRCQQWRDGYDDSEPVYESDMWWTETAHFQGPVHIRPNVPPVEVNGVLKEHPRYPTFPLIVPTQDPQLLSCDRVSHYLEVIEAGCRPTIVALGYVDESYPGASSWERFLNLFVLDGHHKLAAYAESGVEADFIAVFPSGQYDHWYIGRHDLIEEAVRPFVRRR